MTEGLYSNLIERALEAQEQMFYDGFRANTIIINGKKYGRLYNFIRNVRGGDLSSQEQVTPMLCGMEVECANLPDDFNFIIQGIPTQPVKEPDEKGKEENMEDPCKDVDGCPLDGFHTECQNMLTDKCPVKGANLNALRDKLRERKGLKDSGDRTTFSTGAVRDMHEGKGRFDLLPMCVLMRLAKHYEAGAVKYSDRNWEKGIPAHSFADSAFRHMVKYMDGWGDEDHLIAAIWNLCGLAWTEEKHPELIDIPARKDLSHDPNHGNC